MATPLLQIEDLRVDYPSVLAVDNLTIEVHAGEICGLIGPNGAGKTTTMRAICGLQESTHGTVKIDGFDLLHEPREMKRRLGFMADVCPVYEQLTVTEFLDHFGRAYEVPNRAARIEECLTLTWLTDKRNSLCAELSRGMRQRLVLAKTMLPDPAVLLLDEPASGLDPLGRIELRNLLLQMRAAGKAVLISSHILTELSGFCNKAAIMERGRLVTCGTIEELGQQLHSRRMSVKWRLPDDKAASVLKNSTNVKNLVETGPSATFDFEGNTDALDELLKTLVLQGVRVAEWRGAGDDLEQIFLQSGAKELM